MNFYSLIAVLVFVLVLTELPIGAGIPVNSDNSDNSIAGTTTPPVAITGNASSSSPSSSSSSSSNSNSNSNSNSGSSSSSTSSIVERCEGGASYSTPSQRGGWATVESLHGPQVANGPRAGPQRANRTRAGGRVGGYATIDCGVPKNK